MNETLRKIQDGIEQAVTALEELEHALDTGGERKVGACLYLLRHELNKLGIEVDRAITKGGA